VSGERDLDLVPGVVMGKRVLIVIFRRISSGS